MPKSRNEGSNRIKVEGPLPERTRFDVLESWVRTEAEDGTVHESYTYVMIGTGTSLTRSGREHVVDAAGKRYKIRR